MADRLQAFVNAFLPAAQAAEKQTGLPAAWLLGQAAHESNFGTQMPKNKDGSSSNNLFGIKAFSGWTGGTADSMTFEYENGQKVNKVQKFRSYSDPSESMKDWGKLVSSGRYAAVPLSKTPEEFGANLQKAGYATDPKYAGLVAASIRNVEKAIGQASPAPTPADPTAMTSGAGSAGALPSAGAPVQNPLKLQAAADKNKKTVMEGLSNSIEAGRLELQNSIYANVAREIAMRGESVLEDGWFKHPDVAETLGKYNAQEREYLMGGTISRQHFFTREQALLDSKERREQLGGLGKWSAGGSFLGSAIGDPTSLLYAVPGIGELALVSNASRLKNAAATAAGWGAASAGFAAVNPDPLKSSEDVIYAGMFGAALGLGFGALANPSKAFAAKFVKDADATGAPIPDPSKPSGTGSGTLMLGWNGKREQIDLGFEGWNGTRFSTREQWVDHLDGIDERIKAMRDKATAAKGQADAAVKRGEEALKGTPSGDPTYAAMPIGHKQAFASNLEVYVGTILRNAHEAFTKGKTLEEVRTKFTNLFTYDKSGNITGINAKEAMSVNLSPRATAEIGGNLDMLKRYGVATRDDVETMVGAYVSKRAGKAVDSEDKLWAFRRGKAAMKASEALEHIRKGTFTDANGNFKVPHPTLAGLAERLSKLGDRLNDVEIHLFDDQMSIDKGGSNSPHYDYANNRVMMPIRLMHDSSIVLHEIAHAQTWHKIYQWSNNPSAFPEGAALYNQLNDLRKVAFAAWEKKVGHERANNPHSDPATHYPSYYLNGFGRGDFYANNEFIAGLFSGSKEFLQFLDSVPYKGTQTLSSRIWEVIATAIGLTKKEGTALAELSRLVDRTLEIPMTVQTIDPMSGHVIPMMATNYQPHLGVPMDVARAAQEGGVPTTYGFGLGLENRLLGSKWAAQLAPVRELASKLFGSTIGYMDHSVVGSNAWDYVTHLRNSWGSKTHDSIKKNFSEYAKDIPVTKRAAAYEDFNEQVWEYCHGFDSSSGQPFHPNVKAHGDVIRGLLDNDIREAINNPSKYYGGEARSLVSRKIKDEATGTVSFEGELAINKGYFPRKHDMVKWNNAVAVHGRDKVQKFFSDAFAKTHPEAKPETVERFGKWYLQTIESARVNKDQDLITGLMQGHDMEALKDSLMTNGGMDAHEADQIIKGISRTTGDDKGALTANLKRRNLLDESHVDSATGLTMKDFVDTNATRVMEGYIHRQAGAVSSAHHLGVFTQGDWKKALADATSPGLGTNMPGHVVDEFRRDLQFAYDRIMGVPVENPSTLGKSLEMFRNFNVIRLMGGAVFNQIAEMSQIIGALGLNVVSRAVPEYGRLMKAIQSGAATDEAKFFKGLFDGVGATLGERLDFGSSDDWLRLRGENSKFTQSLDTLDNGLRKGASGLLKYSGMTPLMQWQRKVHAVGMVNHIMDLAKSGKDSALFSENRLAWMGMSKQDFGDLKAALKRYEAADKATMWDKLQSKEPELYSKMMTAIQRESRRVVQENDLASAIPIMGKGAAQTFFQFQNFSFQAWNKSMLHAYHQRDSVAFQQVAYGIMLSSLAYMSRVQLQTAGMSDDKRQETLEKRMDPRAILVAGGLFRIPQVSLLPNLIGTAAPMEWLQGAKTTSDVTSIFSSPTIQTISAVGGLIKDPIRASYDDEYQISQKDIRNYSRLIPFNNFMGLSVIGNALGKDFPGSNVE